MRWHLRYRHILAQENSVGRVLHPLLWYVGLAAMVRAMNHETAQEAAELSSNVEVLGRWRGQIVGPERCQLNLDLVSTVEQSYWR